MKRAICLLATLALVAALTTPGLAAKKRPKEGRPSKTKPEKEPLAPLEAPEKLSSFTDDTEKLQSQLGLSEAQVTKLQEMRKKRDDALAKLDEANQKRIDRARARIERLRKPSERQRAERDLPRYVKMLERSRATLATGHEKRMFATLKAEQKAKWNAPILQAEVEKEFEALGLTDAQKEQLAALCEAQAKRLTVPVSPKTHPATIKLLANQVNLRVLTPEQKKEYAKMRAAKAASSRPPKRGPR